MKRIFRTVLSGIGILVSMIIAGIIVLYTIFPPPLSKEATEKDFIKNQYNIMVVTNYLVNSKYNDIYITNSDKRNTMFASLETAEVGEIVSIDDSQAVNAIQILFKQKGYSVIAKKGNTIDFLRSTRFTDFGSGVAYSIDGSKPQLQFLTRLEPLSIENWYYYEEDFNEYRRRRDGE